MRRTIVLRRAVKLLGAVAVTGVVTVGAGSVSASAQTSAPYTSDYSYSQHRQLGNGLKADANGLVAQLDDVHRSANGLNGDGDGLRRIQDANGL